MKHVPHRNRDSETQLLGMYIIYSLNSSLSTHSGTMTFGKQCGGQGAMVGGVPCPEY